MKKQCTVCKKIKDSSMFYKNKRVKSGLTASCIACHKVYRKQSYRRDVENFGKETLNNGLKDWKKNNRDKYLNYKDKYLQKNYEKIRSKQRSQAKKEAIVLSDRYVKGLLTGGSKCLLKSKDIPDELVRAKKQQIELQRYLKGKNQDRRIKGEQ